MPTQSNSAEFPHQVTETIASLTKPISDMLHMLVERGTETVGGIATPIAENPVVRTATKLPGLRWVMAALGQVDADKVQRQVEELRQKNPLDTPEQLAHRVMVDTAMKAAGVGLVTNFIPPLAVSLLAIDLAAITALQAEMIYHIAAIYGFSLKDPTRRGEVLAIWLLSTGGSGVLKSGLSLVEIIPGIGAAVGTTGNAALLYSLGYLASQFYQTKQAAATEMPATVTEIEIEG
ncbi:EcsC family protein [Egbenema bharatensis]|uniref:EcsC family protein n=1 Tax=Egbenema bharatensis TaxID=3463334 RepID=UPI003A8ABD97